MKANINRASHFVYLGVQGLLHGGCFDKYERWHVIEKSSTLCPLLYIHPRAPPSGILVSDSFHKIYIFPICEILDLCTFSFIIMGVGTAMISLASKPKKS